MTMADQKVNEQYDSMRMHHGETHASANGYISQGFFLREQRFLISRIQPGKVLDIACGSGLMLANVKQLDVVGVDYNLIACQDARHNKQVITRGDAFQLPFADGTFDSVANCQFLNQQNSELTARFIKEAARVIKPGGECHILWRGARTLIHKTAYTLDSLLRKARGAEVFPQFAHTPETLIETASGHQMTLVEETMTLPFGPPTVHSTSILGRVLGASHYIRLRKVE